MQNANTKCPNKKRKCIVKCADRLHSKFNKGRIVSFYIK